MGRLKDLASILVALGLLIITAGLVQVLSLGIDWVFNINTTPEFIETVEWTGFFVGYCFLAGEFREMIRD